MGPDLRYEVGVSGLLGLGYFVSELLLVNDKRLTKKRASGEESQFAAILSGLRFTGRAYLVRTKPCALPEASL